MIPRCTTAIAFVPCWDKTAEDLWDKTAEDLDAYLARSVTELLWCRDFLVPTGTVWVCAIDVWLNDGGKGDTKADIPTHIMERLKGNDWRQLDLFEPMPQALVGWFAMHPERDKATGWEPDAMDRGGKTTPGAMLLRSTRVDDWVLDRYPTKKMEDCVAWSRRKYFAFPG